MKILEVIPAFIALAIIGGAIVGAFFGSAWSVFQWVTQ